MGCCCSREGTEETNDEPIITDNNSDTTVPAIAESPLINDEVENTPLDPQAPIATTTNPSVTESPKRETVTSRSSLPTVGDNEDKSVIIAPTAASTPTLTTITRSVPLPLTPTKSVNDEATASEVEESMDKTRGPKASPNEIRNKKKRVHKSPTPEYTEPTEATQTRSEEQLPSSSTTPPNIMYDEAVEQETSRPEDAECRDEDYGYK